MRWVLAFVLAILVTGESLTADHGKRGNPGTNTPLFDDLGDHHMPISTSSATAQHYFDQGIRLAYAFNHDEAVRSFEQATKADPDCAMAHWGIAFALGPNINAPMSEEAGKLADAAVRKALDLSATATERERDYIHALAERYLGEPQPERAELDRAFADAMRLVAAKYPDDLDASTLFAEAMMDTTPWNYWEANGSPRPGTEEILTSLEYVLRRNPDHPGANHYYIHAVEASPCPERGLPSAYRLGELMPGAGHLVHMPSHIYLRMGMYDDAAESNIAAVQADEDYLAKTNATGIYPSMYYSHNVHFLWYARTMMGMSQDALRDARKTAAIVRKYATNDMPHVAWMVSVPLMDMVRFGRWDLIRQEAEPEKDLVVERSLWHFAQGMADLRSGELKSAGEHSATLAEFATSKEIEALETALFPTQRIVRVASTLLQAELAGAKGDSAAHLRDLTEAVALEDKLPYMEPPYWYFPVRHYLGAAHLEQGDVTQAEAVYRDDLKRRPCNGWSLFGLLQSLRRQGKDLAADVVRKEFQQAWQFADVVLTSSRF